MRGSGDPDGSRLAIYETLSYLSRECPPSCYAGAWCVVYAIAMHAFYFVGSLRVTSSYLLSL